MPIQAISFNISSTAASEKGAALILAFPFSNIQTNHWFSVLLYLNRMENTPPEDPEDPDDDRLSGVQPSRRARSGKGSVASSSRRRQAEDQEDIRSDVQEMPASDLGQTIPIETTLVRDLHHLSPTYPFLNVISSSITARRGTRS